MVLRQTSRFVIHFLFASFTVWINDSAPSPHREFTSPRLLFSIYEPPFCSLFFYCAFAKISPTFSFFSLSNCYQSIFFFWGFPFVFEGVWCNSDAKLRGLLIHYVITRLWVNWSVLWTQMLYSHSCRSRSFIIINLLMIHSQITWSSSELFTLLQEC